MTDNTEYVDRDLTQVINNENDPRRKENKRIKFTDKTKNILKRGFRTFRGTKTHKAVQEMYKEKKEAIEQKLGNEELSNYEQSYYMKKIEKLNEKIKIRQIYIDKIESRKSRALKVKEKVCGRAKLIWNWAKEIKNKFAPISEQNEIPNNFQKEEDNLDVEQVNRENVVQMLKEGFESAKPQEQMDSTNEKHEENKEQTPEEPIYNFDLENKMDTEDSLYRLAHKDIIQDDLSIPTPNKENESSKKNETTIEEPIQSDNIKSIDDFFNFENVEKTKMPAIEMKDQSNNISDINVDQEINLSPTDEKEENVQREEVTIAPERNYTDTVKEDGTVVSISDDGKSKIFDFSNVSKDLDDGSVLTVSDFGKSKEFDFTNSNISDSLAENNENQLEKSAELSYKEKLMKLKEETLKENERRNKLKQELEEKRLREAEARKEAEEATKAAEEKISNLTETLNALHHVNEQLETEKIQIDGEEQKHLSVKEQALKDMQEIDEMLTPIMNTLPNEERTK